MTLEEKIKKATQTAQDQTAQKPLTFEEKIRAANAQAQNDLRTSAGAQFANQPQTFSPTGSAPRGIADQVNVDLTNARRRNQLIDKAISEQYGISADEYRNLYNDTAAAQKYVDDLQMRYNATSMGGGGRHFTTEAPEPYEADTRTGIERTMNIPRQEEQMTATRTAYGERAVRGKESENADIASRLEEAKQILEYRKFKDKENAVLDRLGVDLTSPDYKEKSQKLEGYTLAFAPSQMATRAGEGLISQIAAGAKPAGLTDEQIANIRYIYNTKGSKAAAEYAALFQDISTSEGLAQIAEAITQYDKGFGRTLAKGAFGAAAGLSQFTTGARNAIGAVTGTTYPDVAAKGNSIIRNSIDSTIGRGAYDLVVTTANMVPAIVLSAATGNPTVGAAAMGTSAGGNAYAQAMAEGKPVYQSVFYGVLTGISEACLQELIGGISPFASSEGLTSAVTKKITGELGKKVAQEGVDKIAKVLLKLSEKAAIININALFEGGEEYLQDILEPVFRNICFNEKNEFKPFTEEALYSGIIGALSGGAFAGVDVAKDSAVEGILNYSNKKADFGTTAINKALSGETLTNAEIKEIADDRTFRSILSKEAGVEIKGTNTERRALVREALKAISEKADVNVTNAEAQAATVDAEVAADEAINAEVAAESAEALASQATEAATQREVIALDENAQNINVAQEASQSARTASTENIEKRIADFANAVKNYTRSENEVNKTTATVDDNGTITYNKYDGTTGTFSSLRDISDFLMDKLGFNFVGKKPSQRGVAGYLYADENLIRSMYYDVSTIAHEVGHWLDKKLDLQSKLNVDALANIYDKDLNRAGYTADEVGGELVAEVTREYFRNYDQLKADHPDVVEKFESALKAAGGDLYDTIRTAADMFNAYTSLAEQTRYRTKLTTAEAEKLRKKNERTTSMREKVNKFLFNFFDSALPLKIGSEEAYVLQTQKNGNLAAVIQSSYVDGVRDADGRITAKGWKDILSTLTEGISSKNVEKAQKAFDEYLILKDILDSLTVGQRYDEPTRVSKTLETADKTRIIEAKNNINKALATLENAAYKSLRDTLNNLIVDINYSADVRNALTALERALPRYDIKNGGAYSLTNTDVSGLIGDLAKQIKGLSAADLAKFQADIGKLAARYAEDKAFTALFNTLTDLVTRVDENVINQRVLVTESNLNSPEKVQARINEILAANPEAHFEEAEQLVRSWYQELQNLMVDAGIWTQDQADTLSRLHPNYIGLHRAVDLSQKRGIKTKLSEADRRASRGYEVDTIDDMLNYTRKGGDEKIYSAYEQAMYFTNNVIQRVTNNAIIAQFYQDAINDKTVAFEDVGMNGSEPNSLTFYENGKEHHFYVNDPLILAALKWEKPSIGALYAVRAVTNLTKKFATQYNPAFVARNVIRDVQQAYRNGSEDNVIKFAGDWFKSFYEISKSEWAKNRSERAKTPESRAKWESRISETYTAAQAAGLEGAAPWRGMTSRATAVYKAEIGLAKKNIIQKALNAINSALTAVADVTETTTRYAEVKRQLKNDPFMTVPDAVLAGQEVTTNFTRQGASKAYRILDTFIPFLSANIQGTYNNIKQIFAYDPKTGKVSMTEDAAKKIAKTVGIWAIPAILQYALLFMDFDDGENREKKLEAFRAETNYVKNQYWLMWLGDDTFLKIPKSQILNPAFTYIERTLDTFAADDPKAFSSFLEYALDQILLGQFTDLTNITGFGTVYALASNKDWRGVTIDTAKEYNQNLSPRYHYDENTSFPARWLGNLINVSPQQIDYVIGDVLPIAGSFSKDLLSERGLKNAKRDIVGTVLSAAGLKSGITADSVYSTDIKREYYNYKDKVADIAGDAKNVFTPKTSAKDAEKFGKGLMQNTIYTSFNSQIAGTISTAIKAMDDPADKRAANKALNKLMTSLSERHGELSKGGTRLDKDLSELYANYDIYNDKIGGTNLGYWLSSVTADGKTLKVKDIVAVKDNVKAVENAVMYYAYVDKALNDEWDKYASTPQYTAATPAQKLDKYLDLRKRVCYSALKEIAR